MKIILALLLVCLVCIGQSPMGFSTVLNGVRGTLESDVRKLQTELETLNWLHPKRLGLNRKLQELQVRLNEISNINSQ